MSISLIPQNRYLDGLHISLTNTTTMTAYSILSIVEEILCMYGVLQGRIGNNRSCSFIGLEGRE